MRIDIPCSHRVYKGAEFADPPEINLALSNSFSHTEHLIIEYDEKQRDIVDKANDLNTSVNAKAVATIRKFTSCKNVKIISESITELNVDEETQFVAKMPLSFYTEVSAGIHKLHDFRKKRNSSQQDSSSNLSLAKTKGIE